MRYAGFWVRVAAAVLDALICLPVNLLIAMVIATIYGVSMMSVYGPHADGQPSNLVQLFSFLFGLGYYVAFNGGSWQATPGKCVMGIYITRPDGTPITPARALARYFATALSGLLLGIGFLMVAFTKEKTGLHDLICNTRVVHRETRSL